MRNKENHQANIHLTHGLFYHGRYFEHGLAKPNEKKKRDEVLVQRRQKRAGVVFTKGEGVRTGSMTE